MTYYEPRNYQSKTGRVWAISDDITREKGRKATRREVMEAYLAEDGNPGTANVQYSNWSKQYDARRASDQPQEAPTSAADGRKATLFIGSDGRVVIPAAMRKAMNLDASGAVTALLDQDGVLTILSRDSAIARAQRIAKLLDRGEGSIVDELIAERREEAKREDEEE